ncbi:TPA: hypothetical protein DEA21_05705 [Candidatus Uhrbacteria bacterium]|nr:hypothetical protein [Candidatus Uhrbacteria bacterium]HCU32140.1 hypothetical protein [Candidatus Uhrbacteria bacterium]
MVEIFKLIGVLGLILISVGIIIKKRRAQDVCYIIGGTCIGIYSFYLGDLIFIFLQAIFVLAAVYDLIRHH